MTLSIAAFLGLVCGSLILTSCGKRPSGDQQIPDPHLASLGSIEVTAKLKEIPEGAIFKRDLYDYATILRYEVQQVHRGSLTNHIIFGALRPLEAPPGSPGSAGENDRREPAPVPERGHTSHGA